MTARLLSEKKSRTTTLAKKKTASTRKSQIPKNFHVTIKHLEAAEKNDWPNPHDEIDGFQDYHLARGTVFKDWDRAFYTWLRHAKRFNQTRKINTSYREQAILNTLATCVNQGGVIYEQQ